MARITFAVGFPEKGEPMGLYLGYNLAEAIKAIREAGEDGEIARGEIYRGGMPYKRIKFPENKPEEIALQERSDIATKQLNEAKAAVRADEKAERQEIVEAYKAAHNGIEPSPAFVDQEIFTRKAKARHNVLSAERLAKDVADRKAQMSQEATILRERRAKTLADDYRKLNRGAQPPEGYIEAELAKIEARENPAPKKQPQVQRQLTAAEIQAAQKADAEAKAKTEAEAKAKAEADAKAKAEAEAKAKK